ncbi:hypothetical protein Thermo_00504 [Thermoplasmatales archaeon]|nr:hypothetical protein Thermo_00504 [Thermoplasmatales archaeon]
MIYTQGMYSNNTESFEISNLLASPMSESVFKEYVQTTNELFFKTVTHLYSVNLSGLSIKYTINLQICGNSNGGAENS